MTDTKTLDHQFIRIEEDKFAKTKTSWSKHNIRWEKNSAFYAMINDASHHSLDLFPYYAQTANSDIIIFHFSFWNRDGGYPGMSDMRMMLILDDKNNIEIADVVHTDFSSRTGGYGDGLYNEYNETANLQVSVSDFMAIAKANKIEYSVRINGAKLEGVLTEEEMVILKGFYNEVFDPDFEKERIQAFVTKNGISSKTKGSSSCYIATACFEDEDAPEVVFFRSFRDQVLLNTVIGTYLIKKYYQLSPKLSRISPRGTKRAKFGKLILKFTKKIISLGFNNHV